MPLDQRFRYTPDPWQVAPFGRSACDICGAGFGSLAGVEKIYGFFVLVHDGGRELDISKAVRSKAFLCRRCRLTVAFDDAPLRLAAEGAEFWVSRDLDAEASWAAAPQRLRAMCANIWLQRQLSQ